ncbi:hypothetical protein SDC9_122655 [bioreactor metagenome]|uniref:Uncharacterized protein n=1 Tax=bioreactor metagenome TaxID=1076179 RepID=A0A645CFG5_9ZZZZ
MAVGHRFQVGLHIFPLNPFAFQICPVDFAYVHRLESRLGSGIAATLLYFGVQSLSGCQFYCRIDTVLFQFFGWKVHLDELVKNALGHDKNFVDGIG